MKTKPKTNDSFTDQIAYIIKTSPPEFGFNNWYHRPDIQQAYEQVVTGFIKDLQEPTDYGKGRGIVMAGGGVKYFPSLWIGLNRLRETGCNLPVELWHLGEAEIDPAMRELLKPLGVIICDAHETRKKHPVRILNGWELKPYSMLHSSFRELLFLDADSIPLKNPEFLFTEPEYLKKGTIFWADYPHWMLKKEAYKAFGCKLPANLRSPGNDFAFFSKAIDKDEEWDIPVESGQMVVNKSKCWKALRLAMFFCEHSDYYFRFVHGDKETFHMAWRRLEAPYAMPMYWPDWDVHTTLQLGFDGKFLFAHRTGDKWKLSGNTRGEGKIPDEDKSFALLHKLKTIWNGRSWWNAKPNTEEKALIKKLRDKTFFYHRVGYDARLLELNSGGTIGKGAGEHESYWSVFVIDGQDKLIIASKSGPTAFLYLTDDGIWKGKWLVGEGMPVQLIPTVIE